MPGHPLRSSLWTMACLFSNQLVIHSRLISSSFFLDKKISRGGKSTTGVAAPWSSHSVRSLVGGLRVPNMVISLHCHGLAINLEKDLASKGCFLASNRLVSNFSAKHTTQAIGEKSQRDWHEHSPSSFQSNVCKLRATPYEPSDTEWPFAIGSLARHQSDGWVRKLLALARAGQ